MIFSVVLSHAFAFLLLSAVAVNASSLSPLKSLPSSSTRIIDPSFLGLAIESRSFAQYAGTGSSPNVFSRNLIEIFTKKTKAPVFVRVGGTTGDHMMYDPDILHTAVIEPAAQQIHGLTANITIGAPWVGAFGHWPNTQWTVQIPVVRSNQTAAIAFAKACVAAIGLENLTALEIQNEPNFYTIDNPKNSSRPLGITILDYVNDFQNFSTIIEDNVNLSKGPNFQAFDLASSANLKAWNVPMVFEKGLLSDARVKNVADHFYQTFGWKSLQSLLMNHTVVKHKTDAFIPTIQYLANNQPHIPFILSEVGSALRGGETEDWELEASLGTAIWTVDWLLYTMTLGVARVNMQLGTGFAFSPWQPTGYGGTVSGSFYGLVFVADFIGSAGKLMINELETDNENITAYAGYHGNDGLLSEIAIVNLQAWNSISATTPRGNESYVLTIPENVNTVEVRRLTAPGVEELHNITYAGDTWWYENNGLPTQLTNNTQTLHVVNGTVEVWIQASEAILVLWNLNSTSVPKRTPIVKSSSEVMNRMSPIAILFAIGVMVFLS